MAVPTFTLVYTSVRAALMASVIKNWRLKSASLRCFDWVICVDGDKPETLAEALRLAEFMADDSIKVVVQQEAPFNCVRGWNLGAQHATGKVIVAVADDFDPPLHWDEKMLALEPKGWEDKEHVVHTNDGFVKDLCTLAILTRCRYERFGYIFYPQYESMFCDTEFTGVAYRDGVVINAMHLLFEHLHPDCGKRQRDAADGVHASSDRWRRGEMLFNYRKFKGFPLDDGPKAQPAQDTSAARRYVAYMQVNRDDFCLHEACARLMEEGVTDFFFSVPDYSWDGIQTLLTDVQHMEAIWKKLEQAGANVRHRLFKVRDYTFPGDTRIAVETRLRNDSLNWIRREGFNDILIVDGDELWFKGTLARIDELVKQGVVSVNAALVPVIGLPGYPVDRAQDTAVVYIGASVHFATCRTPTVLPLKIHEPCMFHFTGTRRTMEEVVAKHRASGHYDDPDYDFEGWLRDILPNIKPGLRNAHMYKPYQIWPAVRAWTEADAAEIPSSLWRYLDFGDFSDSYTNSEEVAKKASS